MLLGIRNISNLYKPFVVAQSLRIQCLFRAALKDFSRDGNMRKKCLNTLETTFFTLFYDLQQFEQIASKNKMALFVRQRISNVWAMIFTILNHLTLRLLAIWLYSYRTNYRKWSRWRENCKSLENKELYGW